MDLAGGLEAVGDRKERQESEKLLGYGQSHHEVG